MNSINFASLFTSKDILCQTDLTDRDSILRKLLEMLAYNHGIGNVDEAFEMVLDRERKISTVLAPGIAVPHARLPSINNIVIGVATSKDGVQFNGDAKEKTHLIILILAPKDQPGAYLQAIGAFAKLVQESDAPQEIAQLSSPEEVWRYFDSGSMVLPDYVCAGDIMSRSFNVLYENDTLEKAIDMLVESSSIDLPVVDKEGNMSGVVSAYELLHVCLPDYILWMEDLSPIINFEPFAQVLRNENKAWLTEIMSTDYATVQTTAPAIQVAKEITKHAVRQVYVVKGKKLVGVITLQKFIDKVLRE